MKTSVVKQLETIKSRKRSDRERKVWAALLECETADDLAVGLDFATEKQLIDGYFAPHFRGEPVATVADRYWVHPKNGLEMVWIPAGEYPIGVEEKTVQLQGFFLSRHPVTNHQYQQYLEETEYAPDPALGLGERHLNHWTRGAPRSKVVDHPVVWVSYFDAIAYCEAYRMCLPTEWQWECAARGPSRRTFPWGDGGVRRYQLVDSQWRLVTSAHISARATVPVDRYHDVRSAFGCEQMVGNVSEWCESPETREREEDQYKGHLRPVRGCCFKRVKESTAPCSHRRFLSAGRRNDWVGFRPAMSPRSF